jgi:hypothetical protein
MILGSYSAGCDRVILLVLYAQTAITFLVSVLNSTAAARAILSVATEVAPTVDPAAFPTP